MSRVLVTGATGAIGRALVKRLLADPDYEVRVADARAAPQWMREGCEIHTGDLRLAREARAALSGCSHVIHLPPSIAFEPAAGGPEGSPMLADPSPHTLLETDGAVGGSVLAAALRGRVRRFVYVSSAHVLERALIHPTPEEHLDQCPTCRSAFGFSSLAGETLCRAAHDEHGLPLTICRLSSPYGPGVAAALEPDGVSRLLAELVARARPAGHASASARPSERTSTPTQPTSTPTERTLTPTHVDDLADGMVAALGSPAGLNEDFNIAAQREVTLAELAELAWRALGEDPTRSHTESEPAHAQRLHPSAEKANRLLGWRARRALEEGIAATVGHLREQAIASPVAVGR